MVKKKKRWRQMGKESILKKKVRGGRFAEIQKRNNEE